jgi:hypothetical protein
VAVLEKMRNGSCGLMMMERTNLKQNFKGQGVQRQSHRHVTEVAQVVVATRRRLYSRLLDILASRPIGTQTLLMEYDPLPDNGSKPPSSSRFMSWS